MIRRALILPSLLCLLGISFLGWMLFYTPNEERNEYALFLNERGDKIREKRLSFIQECPAKSYYDTSDQQQQTTNLLATESKLDLFIRGKEVSATEHFSLMRATHCLSHADQIDSMEELTTPHATLTYPELLFKTGLSSIQLQKNASLSNESRRLDLRAEQLVCDCKTKTLSLTQPLGSVTQQQTPSVEFSSSVFHGNSRRMQGELKGNVVILQGENYLTCDGFSLEDGAFFAKGEVELKVDDCYITHQGMLRYQPLDRLIETLGLEPISCRQTDKELKAGKARALYDKASHSLDRIELLEGVEMHRARSFAKGDRLIYFPQTGHGTLFGKEGEALFFYDKDQGIAFETSALYFDKDSYKIEGKAHFVVKPETLKHYLPKLEKR